MTTTKDAPNLQLDFVEIVRPRLWMSKTYLNTWVDSSPTAKFNVLNPATSWYDLGSIEAARVPVTKDMFELKDGVPKTSRKIWEVDRTAQLTFNTMDLSPYVEALINGQTVYNTLGSTAGTKGSHVASIYGDGTTRRVNQILGLASTPADLSQYDIVACASPGGSNALTDSLNIAVVDSNLASVLTVRDNGFPIDPVAGDLVQKVDKVEFIDNLGTETIRSAVLFWDTFVASAESKIQHMLYFPKIRNFAGSDLDFKDGSEPYDQAITLTAIATQMTFDDSSVGYNFYKKFVLQY